MNRFNKFLCVMIVVLFFSILILCTYAAAADSNTPPAPTEAVVQQKIEELKEAKENLQNAFYFGTISEVLADRVYDVNAVLSKAKAVVEDANKVLNVASGKRRIVDILAKDANTIEAQKQNVQFVKDITESLDPANLDPNSPTYAQDVAQYADLSRWVFETIKPI